MPFHNQVFVSSPGKVITRDSQKTRHDFPTERPSFVATAHLVQGRCLAAVAAHVAGRSNRLLLFCTLHNYCTEGDPRGEQSKQASSPAAAAEHDLIAGAADTCL